jgi:hypothetical protein
MQYRGLTLEFDHRLMGHHLLIRRSGSLRLFLQEWLRELKDESKEIAGRKSTGRKTGKSTGSFRPSIGSVLSPCPVTALTGHRVVKRPQKLAVEGTA